MIEKLGWVVAIVLLGAVAGCSADGAANGGDGTDASSINSSGDATTTTTRAALGGEDVTAIVGATVFDGERVHPETTVVFSPEGILAVGDVPLPDTVTVVEGEGKTVLPGLIDSHQHVRAGALARDAVFGVTTALDMFTHPELAAEKRKEQESGEAADRADLFSAGWLATSADGHGTQFGLEVPTISGPDEADEWVRRRIDEGSDWIKIVLEHGPGSTTLPTLDAETVTALVEAAHDGGLLALVHVSTVSEAEVAVEAGADGLVHIPYENDTADSDGWITDTMNSGMFVISTLSVYDNTTTIRAELAGDPDLAPWLQPVELMSLQMGYGFPATVTEQVVENASALHEAGVPILAGTDASNPGTTWVSIHGELELLVRAGLTETEALAAATSVPADTFGLDDRGRIEVDRKADLLLVEGDPTEDIKDTRHIDTVWKDGQVLDRPQHRE